jgi:hypothetical protein
MASPKALHSATGAQFSRYLIAAANGVSVAATGNAVVAMPILDGGLTNGGGAANSGGVIVRQVTFQNPNKNIAAANVAILTSNDGNASNAVVSALAYASLTAAGKFQDANIASPYLASQTITGDVAQSLFVQVNNAVSGGTMDIRVYGDVVNF